MRDLTTEWATLVEGPARATKLTPPRLVVLASTFRQFFQPLVEFVFDLRDPNPARDITGEPSFGRAFDCAAARVSSS